MVLTFLIFWDELSFHKIEPAEKFVDKLIEADLKKFTGLAQLEQTF